ncbi:hypothetical protein J2T12_003955 [Paenibacillus anaericanus]|uniref:hypothetical protein n=1 Tax=Paenibacillus anaericanus TaxID=170367 RepID=UPI00278B6A23|nr:hypothetical protein [Paenibacillus anaericanus]MDQ0090532.1 hypothetical protein [Paenibacillus anaericanus]
MRFALFSITTVAQMIMKDLNSFYSNKAEYLNDEIRSDIESWIEWAIDQDLTKEENDSVLEEIHEGLQNMSIWSHDTKDQKGHIQKIQRYFEEKYIKADYITKFSDLVLNYYKEELKYV